MDVTNQQTPEEEQPEEVPGGLDEVLGAETSQPEKLQPAIVEDRDDDPQEELAAEVESTLAEDEGTHDASASEEDGERDDNKSIFASLPIPRIHWKREHIRGYQVGDLVSEIPLLIHPNATLVGNVLAPKVIIAGLLSGSIIAEEVVVANTGQIWGDLCAVRVSIERGGRVQGWTCSVAQETYTRIQEEGVFPSELPEEESAAEQEERDKAQLAILRRLQGETAVALAARAELEHDFERRLSEMAKGASGKINSLNEQVSQLRNEISAQEEVLHEATDNLHQQKSQLERQMVELSSAHDLINRQNKELLTVRGDQEALQEKYDALEQEKLGVDQALEVNERRVEELSSKVHGLEIAHKNSIQHSVDQEEALIRWQELAETTEKQVRDREDELTEIRELLAAKKKSVADLQAEKKDLETKLAALFASVADADETITFSPDAQLLASQLAELEAEREDEEYSHVEQLLWYKANLETSRAAMESLQDQVAAFEVESARLEHDLQQKQRRIENLEQRLAEKVARLEELAAVETDTDLQARHARLEEQLAAQEADLVQYKQAFQEQEERLADFQTQLDKKEKLLEKAYAKLDKAKAMVDRQSKFIQQLQAVTGDKIRNLQEKVAASQHD